MTYSHSRHGQHLIIAFEGNLYDQLQAREIELLTKPHLEAAAGNLILDFSKLEHINSSGLNLLLKLLNAYKKNERTVTIAGANEGITGVLTITKLHTIFGMSDSIEKAIQDQSQTISKT